MPSTLTTLRCAPVERREVLIQPEGTRLESVQLLYYDELITIDGMCWTYQDYLDTLRTLREAGYAVPDSPPTPVVRGIDAWDVTIQGTRKRLDDGDGSFEFQMGATQTLGNTRL